MTSYGKAQKVVNIRRNPKVGIMVESGGAYAELKGVMVRGDCELIEEPGRGRRRPRLARRGPHFRAAGRRRPQRPEARRPQDHAAQTFTWDHASSAGGIDGGPGSAAEMRAQSTFGPASEPGADTNKTRPFGRQLNAINVLSRSAPWTYPVRVRIVEYGIADARTERDHQFAALVGLDFSGPLSRPFLRVLSCSDRTSSSSG